MTRRDWFPVLAILAAGLAAYSNSFEVPFYFDDYFHIVHNPDLRDFRDLWKLLSGSTRPLTALTLAFNYSLGGLEVWGYHLFNLAVHLAAGLTLFGLVRRTLETPWLARRVAGRETELALAAALLWLLHPLQTQSVTYIVQRGEALMGLFYLQTLYWSVRERPGRAVLACALGMLAKPVMVTAPLAVLLYDRVFLYSSWREAFRERRAMYAGLAGTWLVLPPVLAGGVREYGGLVGLDVPKLNPLTYLATQAGVLLHYLKVCFWPHPLLLDYDWPPARAFREIAPASAAIGALLGGTAWALREYPALGFLGAWFFLVLAPTSSLLPIVDAAFDHRMYLPLAAVVLLFLSGLHHLTQRRPLLFRAAVCLLIPVLAAATLLRNEAYGDPVRFWAENVKHRPRSVRAKVSLGHSLAAAGRTDEALEQFRQSLELEPDSADAHNNLAHLLLFQNEPEKALLHYREAARLKPNLVMARKGLGLTLQKLGRVEEAEAELEEALRLNPGLPDALVQLGLIRQNQGRHPEALRLYKEALRHDPKEPAAYNNIGTLLFLQGRREEAARFFRKALKLRPDYPEALENLRKTQTGPEN